MYTFKKIQYLVKDIRTITKFVSYIISAIVFVKYFVYTIILLRTKRIETVTIKKIWQSKGVFFAYTTENKLYTLKRRTWEVIFLNNKHLYGKLEEGKTYDVTVCGLLGLQRYGLYSHIIKVNTKGHNLI